MSQTAIVTCVLLVVLVSAVLLIVLLSKNPKSKRRASIDPPKGNIETLGQTSDGVSFRLKVRLLAERMPEGGSGDSSWNSVLHGLEETAAGTVGLMTSFAAKKCGEKIVRGTIRRELRKCGYRMCDESVMKLHLGERK